MLSFDARALRERGRQQIEELTGLLRAGAKEISGSEDWHALLLELNKDRPATPEAMRRGYEDWTERARQFLHDKGLVSFPAGEECAVVPSPPFQRPVLAVASYVAPPSFAETMRGHFFVPYPPDGASAEEIAKRLESNAYPAIPTTAVHEAYPGHHWHLVMAKGNPSHVRQLFGTSYFAEGWALYAERMMEENGFYDDLRHVMYRYEATLFRAARIVVDTSLHLGEMTHPEAVEFMMANSSMTEPTAVAEVTRYCSWPTQASLVPHRLPGDPAHPGPIPVGPRDRCLRHRRPARLPRRDHQLRHAADRPGRARRDGHRLAPRMSTVAADVDQLAERYWQAVLDADPLQATAVGAPGHNDQLPDLTPDGQAALIARFEAILRDAESAEPDASDPEQALTLAALRQSTDATLALLRADAHAYSVDATWGLQAAILSAPSYQPLRDPADGRDMVARWRAIAPTLAEMEASVRRGLAEGRSPIRASVERVVEQLDDVLARPDAEGPLLAPLAERPDSGWTDADWQAFASQLEAVVARGGATRHRPLPDLHRR